LFPLNQSSKVEFTLDEVANGSAISCLAIRKIHLCRIDFTRRLSNFDHEIFITFNCGIAAKSGLTSSDTPEKYETWNVVCSTVEVLSYCCGGM